ncbi:TetR/AcrR family transcriptional regulator [Nocardia bovistercoris]|uniref:Helix-turn-helix transcriptional regulator n=1 Tax=Nocardia bovistercoris TaxID=2785916 RepID=A0A931IJE4_9NOCA|nr:TetR/AcrR family transcriptional regulator [Nocardia bovistercoris]MBH0781708.1 helix-turn-helix transcriptional regulator [Nocardia bovistercoris]
MSATTRRERERSARRRLIIDTAREMAEDQGWDAVTVRKLADQIEYSQPVLYSHFAGKSAIVSAVAEEGCAELAAITRRAREEAGDPVLAVAAVAAAYLAFATERPAIYDAIFGMEVTLEFGPAAPQPLKDAFAELERTFAPFTGSDAETFTEVAWSSLHGLAALDRGKRLRPSHRDARLKIFVAQWTKGRSR